MSFIGHIEQDAALQVEIAVLAETIVDPEAMFELGLRYASGRAVPVDLVAAHKWFNLAAVKGKADAIPLRREVAELMSDVEIAMAQREARDWMTSH